MLPVIARVVLLIAAAITSWVVAEAAPNYSTIQMVVAVLLWGLFVLALAFWRERRSPPPRQ